MKSSWKTELYYFFGTIILSAVFFYFRPAYDPDNYAEQIVGHNLNSTMQLLVFAQIWSALYFIITILRQFRIKFKNKITNTLLFLVSIIVLFFLTIWHKLFMDPGTAFTEEGLVVYPPLSMLAETEQHVQTKDIAINIMWTAEVLVALIALTSLVLIFFAPQKEMTK